MNSQEKDQNPDPQQPGLKTKQTLFFTQIRRNALVKELRSRRADQYMTEEEVKETLKTKYQKVFEDLVKGQKSAEEFKLKTDLMREMLESISDTYYFNQILAENHFLDNLIENLRKMYEEKLHVKGEYEDSVEVGFWFFCNSLKYGTGFSLFCNNENFDTLYNIAIEVVSARCLSTYCNFLTNFIICLADDGIALKLIEFKT